MQATARRLSVVYSKSTPRRRLIRVVQPQPPKWKSGRLDCRRGGREEGWAERIISTAVEHGERRVFQLCEQSADNVISERILARVGSGKGDGLFEKGSTTLGDSIRARDAGARVLMNSVAPNTRA